MPEYPKAVTNLRCLHDAGRTERTLITRYALQYGARVVRMEGRPTLLGLFGEATVRSAYRVAIRCEHADEAWVTHRLRPWSGLSSRELRWDSTEQSVKIAASRVLFYDCKRWRISRRLQPDRVPRIRCSQPLLETLDAGATFCCTRNGVTFDASVHPSRACLAVFIIFLISGSIIQDDWDGALLGGEMQEIGRLAWTRTALW